MTGKTHISGGILLSSIISSDWLGFCSIVLGSIISDIDHPNSIVGKCIPIIPRIIKHRGITHSLIFMIIGFIIDINFGYGILVHLIMDSMTKKGVRIFYPISDKSYGLKIISTGGIIENIIFVIIWILIIVSLLNRYGII